MEIWKPIKGYEGVYFISNLGRIKRVDNGNFLKPAIAKNGYYIVSLWQNNKGKSHYVHRLLAETFIPNPNPHVLKTVNHKDGNKLNNDLSNLEWYSYSQNNKHAYDIGLKTVSPKVININRQRALKRNKGNNFRSIPIEAFDTNGNFIARFKSIKEATKTLNVNRSTVYRSLKGQVKNPKQYIFKYEEDKKWLQHNL